VKQLEWFIARRYLASRRKGRFLSLITLIAVGGIFLGVTALITVIAVMTGLQQDLQAKIIGANPHIYVFQTGGPGFRMTNWRPVVDSVAKVPGVVAYEPFIMTKVGALAGNETAAAGMLFGVPADTNRTPLNDIEKKIKSGELRLGPTKTGKPGIILGIGLATTISASYGDIVRVVSLENLKTGRMGEIVPVVYEFEVTGVFTSEMYEYDHEFMYTDLASAQGLLSFDSTTVSGVAVNIEDPWRAPEVRKRLDAKLGYSYVAQTWIDLNGALFNALKLEKMAMAVILFLIVIVAAFNIISTLIMVVADKTREIGILKSMGLTDSGVLRIFVLQGITIGVIGTLFGTLAGLGLVWFVDRFKPIQLPGEVYFISSLPVALQASDLVMIVAISLVIAFTATIYPSRQASKLLPVEAIRHE
jgi:lipoprotein-releasing system permease protein